MKIRVKGNLVGGGLDLLRWLWKKIHTLVSKRHGGSILCRFHHRGDELIGTIFEYKIIGNNDHNHNKYNDNDDNIDTDTDTNTNTNTTTITTRSIEKSNSIHRILFLYMHYSTETRKVRLES